MKATIQDNSHLVLFNKLQKLGATATVDEWTEQSGIGGFLGGSTNTEVGDIAAANGDYARRAQFVKYLTTQRQIGLVSTLGKNIVEVEAVEASNGALQLLTDAEFLSFVGDSAVVPTEFDGIDAQIISLNDSSHIIDCAGGSLNSVTQINQAVKEIVGFGNFGKPTDIFISNSVQTDFDNNLDSAARVVLNQMNGQNAGLTRGSPVEAIRTSWGPIKLNPDVFILDENMLVPFETLYSSVATANAGMTPAAVAVAANTGVSGSNWQTAHAGQFYYFVGGISKDGQSTGLLSSAVTVAAGGSVTVTITRSSSQAETGYVIYRSRKNGTSATADLRQMVRIPRNMGQSTTVYTDMNFDFPGTTKARVLSMSPGSQAIDWRQLLPMTKFPLYPTSAAVIPWAQLLFGYLRLAKRKQHVLLKNIVPADAPWKPFA
jgi:hypothetical protein